MIANPGPPLHSGKIENYTLSCNPESNSLPFEEFMPDTLHHFLNTLLCTKTGHLIDTFLLFLIVQAFFGGLYYRLYRWKPENFLFNSDIRRDQTAKVEQTSQTRLAEYTLILDALEKLKAYLAAGGATPIGRDVAVASDISFSVEQSAAEPIKKTDPRRRYGLFLRRPGVANGLLNSISDGPFPLRQLSDQELWQRHSYEARVTFRDKQAKEEERLSSLTTSKPDIWSYLDFFYFSTIVQTTVGFGDILPNSTAVRMLVSLQIILGYALIVVVVNVALG
jgi:hypothetical protein